MSLKRKPGYLAGYLSFDPKQSVQPSNVHIIYVHQLLFIMDPKSRSYIYIFIIYLYIIHNLYNVNYIHNSVRVSLSHLSTGLENHQRPAQRHDSWELGILGLAKFTPISRRATTVQFVRRPLSSRKNRWKSNEIHGFS
jgi:hypothetical protein